MISRLEDRTLVWLRDESHEHEICDAYKGGSFDLLLDQVSQLVNNVLEDRDDWQREYLNFAEFPDFYCQLETSEVGEFLRAARPSAETDFLRIDGHDCFRGLWAVIRHRLQQRSVDGCKRATALFNWTLDCGLFNCDEPVGATLMIGTVEELAPLVLDRILNELPVDGRATGLILQNSLTAMGRRFFPLAPMLRILRVSLMSPNWKESDLARALAYSVVEMYMDEVEGHIL